MAAPGWLLRDCIWALGEGWAVREVSWDDPECPWLYHEDVVTVLVTDGIFQTACVFSRPFLRIKDENHRGVMVRSMMEMAMKAVRDKH